MQITNELNSALAASAARSSEPASGESFADALKKAAGTAGAAKESEPEKTASEIAQEKAAKKEATHKALLAELHDYVNKSPAEHIRDAVLKELGLTEEDLNAMPPEKRKAMEELINERVREKLLGRKPESDPEVAAALALEKDAGGAVDAAVTALQMALAGGTQAMIKAA
ncbi:hypothetical protein [Quatrionicoccus australiensis]|uniref:hypothetical protein n=1 Tax=Quatrionicoccus australiensis TaxID=138118 RepID=UPI001CFAEE45|nr:hypothetical protein [Quatrionicoccus australiensis]MCB4360641.1 hypothetical protein [Quatrionicoccus australiensis]